MMRHLIIALGIVLIASSTFAAVAADKNTSNPALKSDIDKISYSLGYQIGGDFKRQKVEINADAVIQGIGDAVSDQQPLLTPQEMNSLLVELKKRVVEVEA